MLKDILLMISTDKITEIFCSIDDFCKEFIPLFEQRLIGKGKKSNRSSKLSLSEVMDLKQKPCKS